MEIEIEDLMAPIGEPHPKIIPQGRMHEDSSTI